MAASLPLTYADCVCELDVDAFARETTSDLQNLEQDLLHVLMQELGSNLDDPDRGVGIVSLLSGSTLDLPRVARRIEIEFVKDDRVATCTATLSTQSDGSVRIDIAVGVGIAVLGLAYSYDSTNGVQVIK